MPPIMMIQSNTPRNNPVNNFGTENSVFITSAILLICGMFPEPIAVIIMKNANKTAIDLAGKFTPNHLTLRPCSI